jgi:osmoprotectant transport system permease protein
MTGPVAMAGDGLLHYLFEGDSWSFSNVDGYPQRLLEHLGYSALSLLIALVVAFPLGLYIGHTGRFAFLAISVGNAGRALPSLGVIVLAYFVLGLGLTPVIVALVVLAIPPILTTTYAGIRAVSRDTVDAARGVGMKEWQIVRSVEIPNAAPIIFGGIRNAALQVISTATIAAYLGEGGLGRYLFDGLARQDYPLVVGGGIVLALLAVVVDQALGVAQRSIISPGVDGRALRRRTSAGAERGAAVRAAVDTASNPT